MRTDWNPQDHTVRQRIISGVEEHMCVEAGAGTGKTTVLVGRIVEALRSSDVPVEEFVVITFTEKAAAELSARLRRGLEQARRETNVELERRRLDAAIRGLNAAHIETIHAFAASLLRERPVEAKLDPGFEVLDELPQQLAFEGAYSDWITAETGRDVPPPALVEAMNLGLEWRLVREAAERLNRHRDVLPLPPFAPEPPDVLSVLTSFETAFERFDKISQTIRDETNTTYREFARMREAYAGLSALRSHPESLATAICQVQVPDVWKGNKDQWFPPSNGTVAKDALKVIRRALDDKRNGLRQSATAQLLRWLQGFVKYYDSQRRAEGKADFDDLLIWARDLLRDNEEVRAYYTSKYRRIFVDEFQDTDPLQAEMIVRLCAAEDPGPSWRSARLRRGSLFVVGDPKQSIYRFRRADLGMYDDVKRQIFGGAVAEITQNFRSSRPIIEWVNSVFEQLIIEREGVQPAYASLVPLPDVPEGGPLVVRGAVPPPEDGSSHQLALRRAEAHALAALIERSVSTGTWTVREHDDTTRPAEYRDVAVLVPSRTDLAVYEEAFAVAGVPYRHEGGRTFFKRQEVRELIAILRAIDDPGDGVAAVAALRSPAFACSDEDLFLHREHGRFDYRTVSQNATGLVADSLRALRELASARTEVTLPELVRMVIDRLRLVEFAMLQHQGEQAAANLLKIIDQARAFAAVRRGAGLREFVRWLRDNVVRETDETDAAVTEETDDTVRVLTIHAAKGLEFPVVVFANMNTPRPDRTNVIVTRADGRGTLELKLGVAKNGFLTPGYADAEIDESEHSTAEQLRLLYVAATRARDHLVVPLFEIEGAPLSVKTAADAKSLNQHLRRAGTHEVDTFIDAATLPLAVGEPPALRIAAAMNGSDASQDIIDAREIWQIGRSTRLEQGSAKLLVHTATSLKDGLGDGMFGEQEMRRGNAREFGVAVHALLERFDFERPDGIDARATAIAAEFGLQGREDEIASCARNTIGSDVVRRAVASPRLLREVAFAAPLPDTSDRGLAEGRIDLLFVEDGEIVVVDFKTDDVRGNALDRRTDGYRTQALVYAWAAARTTGIPVREVVFLYARAPAERSFKVDGAFLAEAEALFAASELA